MQSRLPRLLRGLTTVSIGLLAAATVAMIVFATFLTGTDEAGSAHLAVPIQFSIDSDAYSLTGDGWGDGTISRASGEAYFEDPGPALTIAAAGTIVAGLAAAFIALILMRRIFGTMIVGTPFIPENARRIRWLGFMVIGAAVVEQVIDIGLGLLVLDNVSSAGLDIDYRFDLNLAAVFVGLIILALAEAFRYGTSLQADADLTV